MDPLISIKAELERVRRENLTTVPAENYRADVSWLIDQLEKHRQGSTPTVEGDYPRQ